MGNIKLLLNTMRKFTPEGQAKIFSALRKTNPDYEEINKLSMSLRGDVVQKGESSKDIIAESLVTSCKTEPGNVILCRLQTSSIR